MTRSTTLRWVLPWVALVGFVAVGCGGSTKPQPSTGPATVATLPDAFVGSWAGRARQTGPSGSLDFELSLSLPPAGSGTYEIRRSGCVGELRVLGPASDSARFALRFTKGQCIDGTVTLRPTAAGQLEYRWSNPEGTKSSLGQLDRERQ